MAEHLGPVVPLLALIGLLARRGSFALCLLPLLVIPAFDFRMDARYLLPFLPFLLLAAMDGGRALLALVSSERRRRFASGAIVTLCLVSILVVSVQQRKLLRGNLEYYPAMREAGLWLRDSVERETFVAGRKPYVSYWAWCKFRRIPEIGDLESLVSWCRQNDCSYLVVHVGVAAGMAPVLAPLLEGIPPEMEDQLTLARVFTVPNQPNETTLLFSIRPGTETPDP